MQLHNISNESGIYRILNTVTNKSYIGSTINFKKRIKRHLNVLSKNIHHSPYLQNSFNKHGINSFKFEILEVVPKEEIIDNKYLTDVEQMYLDTYQTYERDNGYNARAKADSSYGILHTEETKLKLSLIKIGYKRTAEQIEKSAAGIRKNYIFINPEGIEICIIDLRRFCIENNMSLIAMRHLGRGQQLSHKGWTTHKTKQDYLNKIEKYPLPPFYLLSPENIGYEVYSVTDFCKDKNLSVTGLNKIIRKTRKQYKGWKLKDSG